jgi:AcrR family transcriptional regulator
MSNGIVKDRRPVKRPRPRRNEAVIINTTFEDLLMHGFSEVTVESISVNAGIAKTSIYRRWPNN